MYKFKIYRTQHNIQSTIIESKTPLKESEIINQLELDENDNEHLDWNNTNESGADEYTVLTSR